MTKLVLAGDIGGTRSRFALIDAEAQTLVFQEVIASQDARSFEAALSMFLAGEASRFVGRGRIPVASFGIAGPVVEQRVKTTNLPWVIDARKVATKFGIDRVTLLNDLVAVGLGALASPPSKLVVVHLGRPKRSHGNLAVISAGTGLGEAVFVWDGQEHIACPTEGAHVDFAPRTGVEMELLAHLADQYGHVSYERVASGSTISMLYEFFTKHRGVKETKQAAAYVASAEDPNVAVVDLAEAGKSEAAMLALELWTSVYGAETGNLALKCLASSGVIVAGGVSARLARILAHGLPARKAKGKAKTAAASPFVEAFLDKGRMRPLLERIPVAVLLEPQAGLLGAAAHACGQAASVLANKPSRKAPKSRRA